MTVVKKGRFYQRPGFRVGLILSSAIIVLSLAILGFWLTTKALFSKNDNFLIERVVVKSGGWWRKHRAVVPKVLGVVVGETNLFSFSLPELRKKLEKQPSIESARISRIIPDTLVVDINERIPQAFLHWRGNSKVVDSNGVVMETSSCISVGDDLPIVTGFLSKKKDLIPGNTLPQIMPALRLIDNAVKIVPEMRFSRISLNNPDYFQADIRIDTTGKHYKLFISRKKVEIKLRAFEKLLPSIPRSHPNATTIDLRYKEQIVVR